MKCENTLLGVALLVLVIAGCAMHHQSYTSEELDRAMNAPGFTMDTSEVSFIHIALPTGISENDANSQGLATCQNGELAVLGLATPDTTVHFNRVYCEQEAREEWDRIKARMNAR